jgi:hypothetical protein
MAKQIKINGRAFVRRVVTPFGGTVPGYFLDASGRWWLFNDQRGWIEVPSSSRALQHELALEKARAL